MGRHSVSRRYTFEEWVIGISGLAVVISLPILLITVIIAQVVILNK